MKKLAIVVLAMVLPAAAILNQWYLGKRAEWRNAGFDAGYNTGLDAGRRIEPQFVPAYAVTIDGANYSVFVLERKGEAVPILMINGDKEATFNNNLFMLSEDPQATFDKCGRVKASSPQVNAGVKVGDK